MRFYIFEKAPTHVAHWKPLPWFDQEDQQLPGCDRPHLFFERWDFCSDSKIEAKEDATKKYCATGQSQGQQ